ncbi:FAD/NAD(P)-binding protein [Dellaglioa carnosa]|uniref:FAD/NAD(P)-binding protein n=1 Tax=Dellaglioa carnosa TaxID=2995136 RepID=A0ABT4JLP3_9LACO|nr:FAD/NAD(P)-binding protein [Dellaglioa carnosa]MCZ2491290.1 FAD/NAD(P)-binding protein [Dellaglioa carnosa]MCZ2494368.1 FAD/NAD(P)-binding protein [Dellaglioa carnosa]MDK1731216.1 FAD/NAD(P)-binding protein [Dellaglioa carnosa]
MHLAIIGAGPRGMVTLERLIAWQRAEHSNTPLTIDLYDPHGVGGRVWTPKQPHELIMNTAAQQISLFYGTSVNSTGPIITGPNIFEWAQTVAHDFIEENNYSADFLTEIAHLNPNDYATRALFGIYIQWYYAELIKHTPKNVNINVNKVTVTQISKNANHFEIMTALPSTDTVDYVVMSLGNLENELSKEQQKFDSFATENNLTYVLPGFPNETELDHITQDDTVILRGLGLSFFDMVTRLTIERGGRFEQLDNGQLAYLATGKEPHIVAGSRRGWPYHAKGDNQKAPGEESQAHFLTAAKMAVFMENGSVPFAEFWNLLSHEVEYHYYSLLVAEKYPEIELTKFQLAFLRQPEETVKRSIIAESDRFNWDHLGNPMTKKPNADFKTIMLEHLQNDAADARMGTKTGPLTSALEVLRDLRLPVRQLVDNRLLSDDEYLTDFLGWFNSLNNFLTIGPPSIRIEQLRALVDADIVTMLEPGMTVDTNDHQFETYSANAPEQRYLATTLIEARVPAVHATTATSPLMKQLLETKIANPLVLNPAKGAPVVDGAVNVDPISNLLLDENKRPQPGLYFWGVPTDGVHWLTAASPRPFVNDVSLRTANDIVKDIFERESNKK